MFHSGIITLMWSPKLYSVVTLFECLEDPATFAWLMNMDMTLPGTVSPRRYPSPDAILRTMERLPGVSFSTLIGKTRWQMTVRSREDVAWAVLELRDYSGDLEEPHRFYFSGGWDEMILLVATQLTHYCGPLVLLDESGAPPQIVM